MKKEEYIAKLREELKDMPREDLQQIEEYYLELIYDGEEQGYTEEEIIKNFGAPEEVADRVRAEYGGIVVYAGEEKKEEEAGYKASDLVHTIDVEAVNIRIRVRSVESGPVRVLFKPRENCDEVKFEEKDGVFSFKHKMRGLFHLNWLNMFMNFNCLTLEMPKNFAGVLKLKTSNASIRAANLYKLTRGEFITLNGKIILQNITGGEMFLKTSNSFLEMTNLSGTRLEALTNNGNVTAKECSFPEGILMQTKNGFVTGRNLISDNISLQTCNGSITGSVIGNINDYTVESHTVNGSNNLTSEKQLVGPKKLAVKTTNGRIQMEFIQ